MTSFDAVVLLLFSVILQPCDSLQARRSSAFCVKQHCTGVDVRPSQLSYLFLLCSSKQVTKMATTGVHETDTMMSASKGPPKGKWASFMEFMYNKKEDTVLGRTGKSWLQITIFYIIFYGILAAFFAVLLVLFLQTLDPNQPKWQRDQGIIGNTPGKTCYVMSVSYRLSISWLIGPVSSVRLCPFRCAHRHHVKPASPVCITWLPLSQYCRVRH